MRKLEFYYYERLTNDTVNAILRRIFLECSTLLMCIYIRLGQLKPADTLYQNGMIRNKLLLFSIVSSPTYASELWAQVESARHLYRGKAV